MYSLARRSKRRAKVEWRAKEISSQLQILTADDIALRMLFDPSCYRIFSPLLASSFDASANICSTRLKFKLLQARMKTPLKLESQ